MSYTTHNSRMLSGFSPVGNIEFYHPGKDDFQAPSMPNSGPTLITSNKKRTGTTYANKRLPPHHHHSSRLTDSLSSPIPVSGNPKQTSQHEYSRLSMRPDIQLPPSTSQRVIGKKIDSKNKLPLSQPKPDEKIRSSVSRLTSPRKNIDECRMKKNVNIVDQASAAIPNSKKVNHKVGEDFRESRKILTPQNFGKEKLRPVLDIMKNNSEKKFHENPNQTTIENSSIPHHSKAQKRILSELNNRKSINNTVITKEPIRPSVSIQQKKSFLPQSTNLVLPQSTGSFLPESINHSWSQSTGHQSRHSCSLLYPSNEANKNVNPPSNLTHSLQLQQVENSDHSQLFSHYSIPQYHTSQISNLKQLLPSQMLPRPYINCVSPPVLQVPTLRQVYPPGYQHVGLTGEHHNVIKHSNLNNNAMNHISSLNKNCPNLIRGRPYGSKPVLSTRVPNTRMSMFGTLATRAKEWVDTTRAKVLTRFGSVDTDKSTQNEELFQQDLNQKTIGTPSHLLNMTPMNYTNPQQPILHVDTHLSETLSQPHIVSHMQNIHLHNFQTDLQSLGSRRTLPNVSSFLNKSKIDYPFSLRHSRLKKCHNGIRSSSSDNIYSTHLVSQQSTSPSISEYSPPIHTTIDPPTIWSRDTTSRSFGDAPSITPIQTITRMPLPLCPKPVYRSLPRKTIISSDITIPVITEYGIPSVSHTAHHITLPEKNVIKPGVLNKIQQDVSIPPALKRIQLHHQQSVLINRKKEPSVKEFRSELIHIPTPPINHVITYQSNDSSQQDNDLKEISSLQNIHQSRQSCHTSIPLYNTQHHLLQDVKPVSKINKTSSTHTHLDRLIHNVKQLIEQAEKLQTTELDTLLNHLSTAIDTLTNDKKNRQKDNIKDQGDLIPQLKSTNRYPSFSLDTESSNEGLTSFPLSYLNKHHTTTITRHFTKEGELNINPIKRQNSLLLHKKTQEHAVYESPISLQTTDSTNVPSWSRAGYIPPQETNSLGNSWLNATPRMPYNDESYLNDICITPKTRLNDHSKDNHPKNNTDLLLSPNNNNNNNIGHPRTKTSETTTHELHLEKQTKKDIFINDHIKQCTDDVWMTEDEKDEYSIRQLSSQNYSTWRSNNSIKLINEYLPPSQTTTILNKKINYLPLTELLIDDIRLFLQDGITTIPAKEYIVSDNLAVIEEGSFGKVCIGLYKHKEVAIKLPTINALRSNPLATYERFVHEWEIMQRCHHPGIVTLIGGVRINSQEVWLVMERVLGADLHTLRFVQRQSIGLVEGITMCRQLSLVLHYLHTPDPLKNKQIVVHRDIKPENVLVSCNWDVRLCDFGDSEESNDGIVRRVRGATWLYAPPELLTSHLGEQSYGTIPPKEHIIFETQGMDDLSTKWDVWSAGCVFQEMLGGWNPFRFLVKDDAKPEEILAALRRAIAESQFKPYIANHIPPTCREIIERCLSFYPSERPTAHQLVDWWSEILDELTLQENGAKHNKKRSIHCKKTSR